MDFILGDVVQHATKVFGDADISSVGGAKESIGRKRGRARRWCSESYKHAVANSKEAICGSFRGIATNDGSNPRTVAKWQNRTMRATQHACWEKFSMKETGEVHVCHVHEDGTRLSRPAKETIFYVFSQVMPDNDAAPSTFLCPVALTWNSSADLGRGPLKQRVVVPRRIRW